MNSIIDISKVSNEDLLKNIDSVGDEKALLFFYDELRKRFQQLEKDNDFIKDELKQETTLRETLQKQFAEDQKEITTLKNINKGLAEINATARKENVRLFRDNRTLKQQLSEKDCTIKGLEKLLSAAINVKTLNREEVAGIIDQIIAYAAGGYIIGRGLNKEEAITAICKLAYDTYKLKEIIFSYFTFDGKDWNYNMHSPDDLITEIIEKLGGKNV